MAETPPLSDNSDQEFDERDYAAEMHARAVENQRRLRAMARKPVLGPDGVIRFQKTILLRSPAGRPVDNPDASPLDVVEAAAQAEIEIDDEMDRDKLRLAQKDGRLLVAAPALPMQLIEPFDASASFAPELGPTTWGVAAVRAPSSPFNGAGVTVAVLDTGIDESHLAFDGVDFVTQDFTGSGSVKDTNGHGTHCAGTIFGRDIDGLRIGVAPGVTKAVIAKIIGPGGGGSDILCNALMWASDNGAHVISMSLGINFPGWVKRMVEEAGLSIPVATSLALEQYRANIRLFDSVSAVLEARANLVGAQAALVIAATGNESGRNATPPFAITVAPPASSDGVVAVGALGQEKTGLSVAPFSNTRPTVAAPGVNITSARVGGGTSIKSGTSMATPHVAGVAALCAEQLAQHGHLNPVTLQGRLIGFATFSALAPNADLVDVGAGLVQAPQ